MNKLGARHTVAACYIGYITQAIVNNFAPLLFLTFQEEFSLSLTLIGTLVTVNFGVQLLVDLISSKFVDKIGYRPCMVAAHLFAAAGLCMLAFLPRLLPLPAAGLFIASAVYAVGGGLIEVLISPTIEACPSKNKKASMSMLHSFYCWGQVAVVALSTLFFWAAGIRSWHVLAYIWAAVPLCNAVYFLFVPLFPLVEEGKGMQVRQLLSSRVFWLLFVLMFCAGSCEQAVSQWASAFAESGLHVSKTLGDLLGPCMFALFMGLSRLLFSLFGAKLRLRPSLSLAAAVCAAGYALCAFSPASLPFLGLVGCGVVGFAVGIMAGHLFARLRRPPQGRNGAVRPVGAGGRRRLCRGSHRRGRRIGRLRGRHPPGHRLRPRRAAADARCPLFLPRTRKGGAEAAAGQPVSRAVCFFRLAARAPRCIFFAMPPAAVRGRGTRHPSVRIE